MYIQEVYFVGVKGILGPVHRHLAIYKYLSIPLVACMHFILLYVYKTEVYTKNNNNKE